jgi:hypothetical protein
MVNSTLQLSDHPKLEENYRSELKSVLLNRLSRGPMSLESLVSDAEGAYPTDVILVLGMLSENGRVSESNGLWCLTDEMIPAQTKSANAALTTGPLEGLPEPHPLDFDWRFTSTTLPFLRKLINATNRESVAVLGAPSLYKHLADSGLSVWLFDKNTRIVEHLRKSGYSHLNEVDLMTPSSFSPQFSWVMADPPWYPEHYEGFMRAAAQLMFPGGKLLLSVLPRLTRPTASSDRAFIIELAQNLGFDLVEIRPGALGYASPPFETEALHEEGLVLGNWRRGDLFKFVLTSNKPSEFDLPPSYENDGEWITISLGMTTVRINRRPSDEKSAFSFRPASSSGTARLRSVSRRSPSRSEVNVWTSRNIALIVSKPRVLGDTLTEISQGSLPSQSMAIVESTHNLTKDETSQLYELLVLLLQDAGLSWE